MPYPYTYRSPYGNNKEEIVKKHLEEMEELLKDKHEEIAAIIVEPLMQGSWRYDYNAKRILKRAT